MPGSKWHVGHIIAAEDGGAPILANVRPEHAKCSNSSGGKRGAQIINRRRRSLNDRDEGIRTW